MLCDPYASRDDVVYLSGKVANACLWVGAQLARPTHDVSGEHDSADAIPADTVVEFPEWIIAPAVQIVGSLVVTCYVCMIRTVRTMA
jgi:hypothetical protein